jgi:transcription factor TFIIIB component B''
MATLCNDTGQGRVSSKAAEILSNHAAWKKQNREKRARMRELMEARKYGRTEQEAELLQENGVPPTPSSITPSTSHASTSASTDDPNADFDYTQDLAASRFNVQVRIGPNGETVIDEESLVVNREEPDETANYTHVTESDTTKFVNSGTYAKRFRGSRWSAEETELFYDVGFLFSFGINPH